VEMAQALLADAALPAFQVHPCTDDGVAMLAATVHARAPTSPSTPGGLSPCGLRSPLPAIPGAT
jgi:hypothetical protein